MSCFGGQMKIYQHVSIDRFDGNNLNASAYFLSHCHSDHMVGLDSEFLKKKLRTQRHVKLYMSEVSKLLLLEDGRYQYLEPHVVALPIEDPKLLSLSVNNEKHVEVTLLSAGHCPGSVMFLFKGKEGTALYTGDFRLPKGSAARMSYLHSGGEVKKIDYVHFDSTFCIPDAFFIPSREQCLDALISVVTEWINKGSNHIVRLNLSAKYGYEYIFDELYKRFKIKIFSPRAKIYRCLPRVYEILTDDPTVSQIYACFKNERITIKDRTKWYRKHDDITDDEMLPQKPTYKYRNLTLSTMYFTHAATPEEIRVRVRDDHFRLCFSFHSSLSEVCDFLSYIKPGSIHANVIPRQGETFQIVEDRIRRLCLLPNPKQVEVNYKPIGKLKKANRAPPTVTMATHDVTRRKKFLHDDADSDDECKYVAKKRKR